jgi:dihydroneopterin aldolase / 2-amino-4-hydroxy-6-hydroxymethyldihydropteridine diphosphokinase
VNSVSDLILGPHGRPLDRIRLLGVTARGYHGVLAAERENGQDFTIDVVLHLDTSVPAATDDLALTADYGLLATQVADVVRGEPFDLIETLAERIAQVCLVPAPVHAVDVTVHKPYAPITERFADVQICVRRVANPSSADAAPLTRTPITRVEAVLALGSNLGDREATLRSAVLGLRAMPGITVQTVSPVLRTASVGGPPQPDYFNAVVLVTTSLSAHDLLQACHRIEAAHDRVREVRWGPRTLDIDVIRYGALVSSMPELTLPHPRAAQRAFVLAPWLAADPEATLPVADGAHAVREVSVADLLAQAPDRDGVHDLPGVDLVAGPAPDVLHPDPAR